MLTLTRRNAHRGERIQIAFRDGGPPINATLVAWTTNTLRVRRWSGKYAEHSLLNIAHVRSYDR